MPRRRHYRRRRRRRASHVSESVATYQIPLWYGGKTTSSSVNTTKVERVDIEQIVNDGTTNRKIVRIKALGSLSTSITNASLMMCSMFWAHPKLDDTPSLDDFDPFSSGPSEPGGATYKGRPSPRPFGRHMVVQSCQGNNANTLFHTFAAGTKAARLIRPGWELSHLLYTRATAVSTPYEAALALNIVVEG